MTRLFRAAGLMGGGILAIGAGALGTHFAYPHLESSFNPQRKQREEFLKKSLEENKEKVEYLNEALNKSKQEQELQQENVITLKDKSSQLKNQISEKQTEIDEKNTQINFHEQTLKGKKSLHQQQSRQISELGKNIQKTENETNQMKTQKEQFEARLGTLKTKLALTNEEILHESAMKYTSPSVDIREIKHKGFSGGMATFETKKENGDPLIFKVKQGNLADREERANFIKKHGMPFDIADSFNSWEKTILLNSWEIDYEYKASNKSQKRYFLKNQNSFEFKITDYFREQYLKDAFKVLVALSRLDDFPLCLDTNSQSENIFVFCEDMKRSPGFESTSPLSFGEFSATEDYKKKWSMLTSSFKSKEDFLGYWIKQTVRFIKTGTVDFFDFLNPVLLSKNYMSQ